MAFAVVYLSKGLDDVFGKNVINAFFFFEDNTYKDRLTFRPNKSIIVNFIEVIRADLEKVST